jgi:hypothetical protein
MTVEFLRTAAAELEDAVAYYNEQSEGLGYQLAVEVQKTLNRIAEFPRGLAALVGANATLQVAPLPLWRNLPCYR